VARFRVTTTGGAQPQEFLELELVPTWLLMINAARVGEGVRPRLTWLQRYIVREVYRAFAALAGLPEQESRQIEDLVDLGRLNAAIGELTDRQEALETRQGAIEASQDQARQAWRDIRAEIREIAQRVAAMEQRVDSTISREQRGYLYQLVQAWGAAKAAREPRLSKSAAYAACWTLSRPSPHRPLRGSAGLQVRRLRRIYPAILSGAEGGGIAAPRAGHTRPG
jgi:hypothetical protein